MKASIPGQKMVLKIKHFGALALGAALVLSGCASSNLPPSVELDGMQRWALLPMNNLSATPLASQKAEALLRTHLQNEGLTQLVYYPELQQQTDDFPLLNYRKFYLQTRDQARANGITHAITGDIVEWGYKSGLDGEPVVSVTLRIINVNDGSEKWSGSVSRSGWGFQSLGNIADKVIDDLVSALEFS